MGKTTQVELSRSDIEPAPTLDELAATIRHEHDACLGAARTTVEHAIRAGEALLQARDLTKPTGQWMSWLRENFPKHRTAAYNYMRLAAYRDLIPPGAGIFESHQLIRGLPAFDGGLPRPRIDDARKEDAQQMREEGVGYKTIAKSLGVSVSTVHAWFSKGTYAGRVKKARKLLREKEKEAAVKRTVRKVGGAIAEAYSIAERMGDVLGQAHREAKDTEARRALERANEYHHATRDAIVRALGVES